MVILGFGWLFMTLHGLSWHFMALHGVSRLYMDVTVPCFTLLYLAYHGCSGLLMAFIVFHDFSWLTWLCTGCFRLFVHFNGFLCLSIALYSWNWWYMALHVVSWLCLVLHGPSWFYAVVLGFALLYIAFHRYTSLFIALHGFSCLFMAVGVGT